MSILGTDSIERTQVKKLALSGFDGPAMASLELFLSKENGLRVVGADQADLLIVNGDQGVDPDELKATYTEKYSKPGILISVRDLSWPGFVLLKKPYSSDELLDAIRTQSVSGSGSADAHLRAETRVAAIMGIEEPAGTSRNEAYDSYMSRAGAGQEAIDSLNSEKSLKAQQKLLLKEKLRRGKEAAKRAAEHASRRNQELSASAVTEKPEVKRAQSERLVASDAEDEVRELLRQAEAAQKEAKAKAIKEAQQAKSRVDDARKELERLEEQKREAARLEAARKEAERKETARIAAEEKAAAKRAAEKKALAERRLAEKKALERKAVEQRAAEKKAAAHREALKKAKIEAEAKAAAEKLAAEKRVADKKAAEKLAKAKAKAADEARKAKEREAKKQAPLVEKGALKLIPDAPEVVSRKKMAAKPAIKSVKKSTAIINDDEMVYRCCGNLADVDVTRPDERRRIYFNTDGALLYWLPLAVKKAKLSNTPVEIAGLPRCFVYLPEEDRFFGDFGEDLLLQYALSRFGFGELDLKERLDLAVSKPESTGDKKTLEDRDAMIWKIALWTARGRLNQRMDPEKVYKLKERPDFSRMIEIPHAPEITELWFDHRLSALDIVRILNVPQRYVFAYMSAADALGWLQE
ncbi:MAG: hypothetical protein KC477_03690 [Oceanospirillaceae bacterium]|nr:hypothetical protein [Oceanospirillaceae bacterium]